MLFYEMWKYSKLEQTSYKMCCFPLQSSFEKRYIKCLVTEVSGENQKYWKPVTQSPTAYLDFILEGNIFKLQNFKLYLS